MDSKLLAFMESNYNMSDIVPVYITDDNWNIPDKLCYKISTPIKYDYHSLDAFDLSHEWLCRTYGGSSYNEESVMKFTRGITVNVIPKEELTYEDDDAQCVISHIRLNKKSKRLFEAAYNEAYRIISMFIHGEQDPINYKDIPNNTEHLNLYYEIGQLHIFQDNIDDSKYVDYYFGIVFKSRATFDKYIPKKDRLVVYNG